MLRKLLNSWADWSGDRSLDRAIHGELRRLNFAVHASTTREVRLVAIERPGWVQVRRFWIETLDASRKPVTLLGLARDDGRKSRIEVLLTRDRSEFAARLDAWSEGLIRRS